MIVTTLIVSTCSVHECIMISPEGRVWGHPTVIVTEVGVLLKYCKLLKCESELQQQSKLYVLLRMRLCAPGNLGQNTLGL